MTKAIVLLSGGLDSTTCLYWAKKKGFSIHALLFDYGQKHNKEMKSAILIAGKTATPCKIIRFSLPWGTSALIDKKSPLPKKRNVQQMVSGGIPITYVPARNTIFLSFALSFADAIGASAIIIGANAVDFSGYPDCRPNYINAMQKVALLGTKVGSEGLSRPGKGKQIKILAPLIKMSKAQIIRLGYQLGVPYNLTWSCYQGAKKPCGECDSCILRKKGFDEAEKLDPLTA